MGVPDWPEISLRPRQLEGILWTLVPLLGLTPSRVVSAMLDADFRGDGVG